MKSVENYNFPGLTIIPADELLKYKIPKYLFGDYKQNVNYTYGNIINTKWITIHNCGYNIPPEVQPRVFDIFMSISIQQKEIKRTLELFRYYLNDMEMYIKKFMSVDIQNTYRALLFGILAPELTVIELEAIVRFSIILKVSVVFNRFFAQHTLLEYVLEMYDMYGSHKYIKKQIGKLSLRNKDTDKIIKLFSKYISKFDNVVNQIANIYIEAISKYREEKEEKEEEERQKQMKYDQQKQQKESEQQRQLAEINAFMIFLSYYCNIRSEHVDIIIRSVPHGINCKTIYNVTNEFLNKYIPVASIKNITDALSGIPNKHGNCPLCYLYNNDGPSCKIHGLYKPSKTDAKCTICMENKVELMVRCNHEFCSSCINEWLKGNMTCPICRVSLD